MYRAYSSLPLKSCEKIFLLCTELGTKVKVISDVADLPVTAHMESASHHEVKPVGQTIDNYFTLYAPDKHIGDKP